MHSPLQRLIDALREELQHYGAVLALLEPVVPAALRPGDPLNRPMAAAAAAGFADAARALLEARAARERCQQQLAWACQQPADWAPADLLQQAPRAFRPLLGALFEENDSLQDRVRRHVHPGHPWLGQAGDPVLVARLLAPTVLPVPLPVAATARPGLAGDHSLSA
ncbi:MAG: hypothetical protein RJA22_1991 [Verrucomicrobiota bacterium]|jgi:hypothetical protein